MTNSNNDIEELEELLTELEGQEAQLVRPYAEDDDAVTQLMDAPLGDQEWMVQVTALDRRMMSTPQLLSELQSGKLSSTTLVWRGGMDDWLPIAHVDELSQVAARPTGSSPRMALGNLPAAQPTPSQPTWSSAASSGLPPPPVALPPATMLAPPPPSTPMGLSRPMAAPLPPPPVSLPPQSSNTTRPVAVDFSDITPEPPAGMHGKRAVMALSAMAILAVFVTVYAVSSGGDGSPEAEAQAAAQPQAVNPLQPAGAEKRADSTPAEPAPEPKQEPTAAKGPDDGASEEVAAVDEGATRQANAPARYSPRSDYRRRTKSSSDDDSSSSSPKPTAAVSPPPRASSGAAEDEDDSQGEVAAAPADDDADSDEAPRSTGKAGSTFNRDAAKQALDEAASQAKNCRPQGGPSGTGRVQVRYEPSGKVAAVAILTSKFENTTTGSCVRMLFRRAKVPEFTGAPVVVVNKSFEIP